MFYGYAAYKSMFCSFVVDFGLLIALMCTVLGNPGFPDTTITENDIKRVKKNPSYWCPDCKIIRKKEMCHCEDCDACITDYDHHCPWMGKCIGGGNLIAFYCFIGGFFFFMLCNAGLSIGTIAMDEALQKSLKDAAKQSAAAAATSS